MKFWDAFRQVRGSSMGLIGTPKGLRAITSVTLDGVLDMNMNPLSLTVVARHDYDCRHARRNWIAGYALEVRHTRHPGVSVSRQHETKVFIAAVTKAFLTDHDNWTLEEYQYD